MRPGRPFRLAWRPVTGPPEVGPDETDELVHEGGGSRAGAVGRDDVVDERRPAGL